MTELMYMASPYTPIGQEAEESINYRKDYRYTLAVRAAAELTTKDLIVFSPIAHSHPIARLGALPGNWEFWNYFDEKIISICDRFAILELYGWKESVGIRNEISIAIKNNLTIEFIDQNTYEMYTYSDPVQLLKELNVRK